MPQYTGTSILITPIHKLIEAAAENALVEVLTTPTLVITEAPGADGRCKSKLSIEIEVAGWHIDQHNALAGEMVEP